MKNFKFKWLLFAAAMLLSTCNYAYTQTQTGEAPIKWVSALPATCVTTNKTRVLIYKYTATTGIYYCSAANTWTQVGTSTMSYPALASDGSASAPAFSFSSDTDTGIYRSGANTLNFATGGTLRATLSSAGLLTTTGGLSSTTGAFTSPVTSTQGTITTSQPFIDHTATWNDAGVTFSNIKSNVTCSACAAGSLLLDLQKAGTSQFKVSNAGLGTFTGGVVATTGTFSGAVSGTTGTFTGVVDGANGSAAAPAITFTSDTDTGIFRSGANALGFTTGGTERGTLSSAGLFTTTGGLSSTTGAFSSTITGTGGTITASTPFLTNTATWNSGGVTFKNIFSNVTCTACANASALIDLQLGGVSKFTITKASGVTIDSGAATTTIGDVVGGTNTVTYNAANGDMTVGGSGTLSANTLSLTNGLLATSGTFSTSVSSSSPTAGIGYATGAGGAQTQATSKATTVVSNTVTTAVTMHAAQLDAATTVAFTFTNSAIAATDTVICTHQSAGTSAAYVCNAFPGAGSAVVSVRNVTAGNLSEAIVLRITVIKSVSN